MATPFDNMGPASVSSPNLEALANRANFTEAPKRFFRKAKLAIVGAQDGVRSTKDSLLNVRDTITGLGAGAQIPEALTQELESSSRAFNNRASNLGFLEGKIIPSIKGAIKSIGATLGFDTSKIGAAAMSAGEINGTVINAFETKANIIERVISKPIRVAANNPKTAIAAIAAGTAYGAVKFFRGRAEKRTQHEISAQANAAQAEVITAQTTQPSYTNSASYADVEARIAVDRASGVNHADAVSAARQSPATAQTAAGL